jgi:hypothetical protein
MTTIEGLEFLPESPSPFPCWASPYRQKGHGYLGDMAFFDRVVPGGSAAVVASIRGASLRAFLEQRFHASEWYDAYPGVALHRAAARLCRQPFDLLRERAGAYHAETAGTLYHALLRCVSTENVALWGPRVASIYFEFGKIQTQVEGPTCVTGRWGHLPAGFVQFVAFAARGFTERTLVLAGARSPRFEIGEVEPDGEAHGQPLHRVAVGITWS